MNAPTASAENARAKFLQLSLALPLGVAVLFLVTYWPALTRWLPALLN